MKILSFDEHEEAFKTAVRSAGMVPSPYQAIRYAELAVKHQKAIADAEYTRLQMFQMLSEATTSKP